MPDEKFNIDDFILSTNEGSGELELGRQQTEQKVEENKQVDQRLPDNFQAFDSRISSINDTVQRQSNAIAQLIQYTLSKESKPETLDTETLGNVFGDADKGTTFLNTLTQQIERIIDSKMVPINQQLAPMTLQNQLNQEMQLVRNQPDFVNYAQGISFVLDINPQLTLPQAYQVAKQRGLRTEVKQQQSKQQGDTNVVDINRRQLPNPTNSSNANLQTKQVSSVRDALELALEQLA